MNEQPSQSSLFITGGEWLYQLEVRGIGGGQILSYRTRSLDPHTRFPLTDLARMSDLHEHNVALAIEESWRQHVMIAGELGHELPMIELVFADQEF